MNLKDLRANSQYGALREAVGVLNFLLWALAVWSFVCIKQLDLSEIGVSPLFLAGLASLFIVAATTFMKISLLALLDIADAKLRENP